MTNSAYLNRCRRSLLSKQRELVAANGGRLVLAAAGSVAGADLADQACAESDASIEAHLSQVRSSLRQSIEWALVRLNKGNYGTCAVCGDSITRARLKAVPWTECCRDCMEQAGA